MNPFERVFDMPVKVSLIKLIFLTLKVNSLKFKDPLCWIATKLNLFIFTIFNAKVK